MQDDIELLNEMEQLNERNIHANKLFHSFRSVPTPIESDQFNALLLYFVACLISNPLDALEGEECVFVRRTNAQQLVEKTIQLIQGNSAGLVRRDIVVEALTAEFANRLMDEFQYIEPHIGRRKGFALRVFDIMLRRILSEDYRISFFHAHVVASLAVSLSKPKTRVVETFPYSGASCVTANVLKKELDTFYRKGYGHPYAHQDLINLRLKLRNLEQYPLPKLDAGDLTIVDSGLEHGHQFPALATVEKLINQDTLGNLVLVIIDRDNGHELPESLKHHISKHDLLEAVIDLPSQDRFGKHTVFTAWLLNVAKKKPGETLCIDASRLKGAGYFEPTWFAAATVDWWQSRYKIGSRRFNELSRHGLNPSFLKHLETDYRDLPGFCCELSTEVVLSAPTLTAYQHLGHEENKLKLNSPDNRPLLGILSSNPTAPVCIYIIGNNGSGKSQLLADLITDLNKQVRSSVGIAFGGFDRFPLERIKESLFEYQGTRREVDDLHPLEFLHTLSEALHEIYQDASRIEVFNEELDLLKFNGIHYLAPINDPDNPIDDWERWMASFKLFEGVQVPMGDDRFEPGVQRSTDPSIVPFRKLSSGEQQILSLLIRICANAADGMVFLIDEPEISLHVQWQQQLPHLFSRLANSFECSFVVATHSPILVANARDAISHCFVAEEMTLTAIPSHQRHSVESILLDGFKTCTPDNNEINERCAVLVSRAIRVTNQPGRLDYAQRKVLRDALALMKKTLKGTASDREDERYEHDMQLIDHADAAIKELFKRAKDRVPS
ncbi:AAA family ATPase [Pseudomonas costantinii]|uniref:AAA family ATPase n=1 Tax=Pseudomonas costantinii TaxID=168469 RepID=UPI0015A0B026|nr:AAA family ATPase [Pseudomonas costantinii]NVZ69092.1 ATP-binding protein [Pseudomonas costantinii]